MRVILAARPGFSPFAGPRQEPPTAPVIDVTDEREVGAMTMVSLDELRSSPNPVGTALATIAGVGLLIIGISWIAVDRSLLVFEIACIVVGLFALPPVGRWMREQLNMGAGGHWFVGTVAMVAAFAWTICGPSANSMNERFANNPMPVIASASAQTTSDFADAEQSKSAYLQNISAAQTEVQVADPASFSGGHDAVMAGLRTLAAWRALTTQAASFTLTADEQAQVKAFGAAASKQSAVLMPVLRRAYAESLRDALSSFGVTAETTGDRAEMIQVVGYALNDQSVLSRVKTLLGSDLTSLGFKQTDFVAEKGAAPVTTPAVATTASTPAAAPMPAAVTTSAAETVPATKAL
jgi:hypothetical protein